MFQNRFMRFGLSIIERRRVRSFEHRVSSRVPTEGQRFTLWLKEQINQGADGLEWIEKEKGIFRVPSVQVDKTEFELETQAELFIRWAQHTGKYRQGDQPDPSTWKTRFLRGLRIMQEIVEIKELRSLEGSKPYRVFKFKPKLKDGVLYDILHRPGYQPVPSKRQTRLIIHETVEPKLEIVSDGRVILFTRETHWSLEENKPHRAFKFKPKPKDKPVQLKPVFQVQPCRSRRFARTR